MVSPAVQRQFEQNGIELIPAHVGRERFLAEVLHGVKREVEVTIAGIAGQKGVAERSNQPADSTANDGMSIVLKLPLLQAQTEIVSEGASTRLLRTLSLDHDRYLKHHVLGEHAVLPFAVAMELMAEAAQLGAPEKRVMSLSNVRVLQGVVLEQPEVTVEVTASVKNHTQNGSPLHSQLVEAAIVLGSSSAKSSYRATVELGGALDSTDAVADALRSCGEPPGESAGAMPLSVAAAYEEWLFHGPLLQAIKSVESIGPSGVSGTLQLSDPMECLSGSPSGSWLLDPVLLDAAFQMQLLWGRVHWDVTLLPSRVQRYVRLAETAGLRPGDLVRCELRIRPETKNPISHTDIAFFDRAGKPIGVVVDLEGSGSGALNRLVGAGNWRGL